LNILSYSFDRDCFQAIVCLGLLFLIIAILLRYQHLYLLLTAAVPSGTRSTKENCRERGDGVSKERGVRRRSEGQKRSGKKATNDSLELVSASRFICFDCSLFLLWHSSALHRCMRVCVRVTLSMCE